MNVNISINFHEMKFNDLLTRARSHILKILVSSRGRRFLERKYH